MNIKKAYYYFFYWLYKLAMTGAIKSLSRFYATLAILVLEIWFALSYFVYYKIFVDRHSSFEVKSPQVIAFFIAILILNYYAFMHTDNWKEYVAEFDQWPKSKNNTGRIIVICIIAVIISNLIFSFYLMSRIDWQNINNLNKP
jgi:energy-coupling factor transporter transmembrane protein EcfT